jgi:SAM-dependent methyltransferase
LKCYSQASGVYWDERPDPHERRFDLIRRMLVTHADGRRILDVGCFNGAFLEFLGPEWDRFGIEPGNEASSLARARGVTIVAPTLDMLPSATGPFDSVIAIDVVEHVVDPLTFFRAARRVLNPNGVLIIVTGDTAARTWRWERARYWYCSIPEHLSFFSHRTVEWVATELGMQCVEFHRSCHQRWPIRTKIRQAANNVAYLTCLRSKGFGIAPLYRAVVNRPAPAWITANDHMFCAMKCV